MSDDETRVAIWGKMGYERKPQFDYPWSKHGEYHMAIMWGDNSGRLTNQDSMPDPLTDLNAMHEAEKTALTDSGLACRYRDELGKLTDNHLWHATARQRAEAMCRTLWPERFNH